MTQAGDFSAAGTGSQAPGAQSSGAQISGAQTSGAQASGVLDQAKDTAQNLAGQVKEQVGQRAQTGFDQAKTRAADTLSGVAQTLRTTTQQLQDQHQAAFATPYIDRAAGQVEQLANYVRTADVQELAERSEDLARRQPAIFLGGLFALGLAGARFLKSSRRNDGPQTSGTAGRSYPNYGSTSATGTGASAPTRTMDATTAGTGSTGRGAMGTSAMGTGSAGTSASTPSTGGSGLSGASGMGTSGRGDR